MSLRDWFASKKKKQQLNAHGVNRKLTDTELEGIWAQCFRCQANLRRKELKANLHVCLECGYHMRIGAHERIAQLTSHENDTFFELDQTMRSDDPLKFTDTKPYLERQDEAHKKTGLNDAIITGIAQIHADNNSASQAVALGVMDFTYLGGSMGSVVGEKITRLIECAMDFNLPLVMFSSSGGARMQEGTLSLMQMVKTGSALAHFHEKGLLYLSVMSEPTFGGVTASFATLGDINIAEKGARIGFAGRRVIEQTIRQKLPSGFQTAEYLLKYGQVDMVTPRSDLRPTLLRLIQIHRASSKVEPKPLNEEILTAWQHRQNIAQPSASSPVLCGTST